MFLKNKYIAYAVTAAVSLAVPAMTLAVTSPFADGGQAKDYVSKIGTASGVATTRQLPEIIGTIINIMLGFMGIFLLVYIMYAGFLWMTADGKETEVAEAQKRIKNAIIGLVIILSSYAISNFVMQNLVRITTTG